MHNMKRRILCVFLLVCMVTSLLATPAAAWSDAQSDLYTEFGTDNGLSTELLHNMEEIYNYLMDNLGLNSAAACGLLANMYRESRFDPDVSGSSSSTIGIVQWYGSNRTAEIDWCTGNGYDPYSLEGQLAYLSYQFHNTCTRVYSYLLSVEDSASGAYDAGYYFCYNFERPSNYATVSVGRGTLAEEVFYPFFQSVEAASSAHAAATRSGFPFKDVAVNSWYYDTIYYAYQHYLVDGITATVFSPSGTMTRAQAIQILYNMNDKPSISITTPFLDVSTSSWYYSAIAWAWSKGIVNGTSTSLCSPTDEITREQMVQLLYNYYVNYLGYSAQNLASLTNFPDNAKLTFGTVAMQWAVGNGIVTGTTKSGTDSLYLNPKSNCTRAEGVSMLVRFVQLLDSE